MAIYKSSHHYPSLSEVDFNKPNEFSCQVNTSGESVQAYKIQILSGRGDEVLIDGNNNDKIGTNLSKPIKNKGFLKVSDSNFKNNENLVNGKDYQWGIRTYAAPIGSTEQPKTLVCSGFLVGSTQYVIWVNLDTSEIEVASDTELTEEQKKQKRIEIKDNMNNLLQYDRYIEFKIPKADISSKILPFAPTYETDVTYPPESNDPSANYYVQRRKIDWVEKDLGKDKTVTKIETEENFDYNFADGTQFSIYLCSDQHTPNAIYVDPNDIIEPSNYIVIYNSKIEYDAAKNDTENANDPTKGSIRNAVRKIYGYSSDTGEIRVQEAYGDENDPVPVNGNYYRIFEYDMVNKTYTEKTGSIEQVIGGSPLKDSNNLFKVYSNKWTAPDAEDNRLFIQPNINIKIDRTNYNEIVFDDGTRVDIVPNVEDIDEDDTFEKLDNTQWLLKGKRIGLVNGSGNLYDGNSNINNILPKTNYSVYTDFMDSSPYEVFYARKTPKLEITYTNANAPSNRIENVLQFNEDFTYVGLAVIEYRDICFRTAWLYDDDTLPLQNIKYYQYKLYDEDGDLISQSEQIYSTEMFYEPPIYITPEGERVGEGYKTIMTWDFKGLESGISKENPRYYTIELIVVDEYGETYHSNEEVKVYYKIKDDFIPLVVEVDCEERAISIEANAPVYAKSTDDGDKSTVDGKDIMVSYLQIPAGEVLNYTTVVSDEEQDIPIIIAENMSLLTKFQITPDFIDTIPIGGELEVIKFASKHYIDKENNIYVNDTYRFTIGSFVTYYVDTEGNYVKNNNQFKLRWYKNNNEIPLNCFDGESYANLSLLYDGFVAITKIKSAIQERGNIAVVQLTESDIANMNSNNVFSYVYTNLVQNHPELIDNGKTIDGSTILLKDVYNKAGENISSRFYSSGIYIYNTITGWEPDLSTEYIFIDDLEYVSNLVDENGNQISITKDTLGIPDECWDDETNSVLWVDTMTDENGNEVLDENNNPVLYDFIWIENNHINSKNKETLGKTWFTMYFVSNTARGENQYSCDIILDRREEKV